MIRIYVIAAALLYTLIGIADAFAADTKSSQRSISDADKVVIPVELETIAFRLPGTGWDVGAKSITREKSLIEFVPTGQTSKDWKEIISFQTFQVPPATTVEHFYEQIAAHWQKNCRNVQSSLVLKKEVRGRQAMLGLTDCPEASYSRLPEYMMYELIRSSNRLHIIQRSIRGKDIKVQDDDWVRFFDSINICGAKEKECSPTN